ncbi:MAG: hypothetical protein ACR652_00560 [Methylocystis sp.]|uniref:hypothetical protein n=1 Tax=Methylocystis sp. TaxID=1911079 RepID=UPI003DA54836
MSEKSSETKLSALLEVQTLVRDVAGVEPGDSIKAQIARAARRIGFMSASRVKDCWYADSRMKIGADELRRLREIANALDEAKEARDEFAKLKQRVELLEAALRLSDSDAYRLLVRPQRDGHRQVHRLVD